MKKELGKQIEALRKECVVVTKNLDVTVNNQDEHNVNFLVSFPPQCSEKKYYQTINKAIHQELSV